MENYKQSLDDCRSGPSLSAHSESYLSGREEDDEIVVGGESETRRLFHAFDNLIRQAYNLSYVKTN